MGALLLNLSSLILCRMLRRPRGRRRSSEAYQCPQQPSGRDYYECACQWRRKRRREPVRAAAAAAMVAPVVETLMRRREMTPAPPPTCPSRRPPSLTVVLRTLSCTKRQSSLSDSSCSARHPLPPLVNPSDGDPAIPIQSLSRAHWNYSSLQLKFSTTPSLLKWLFMTTTTMLHCQ